MLFGKKCQRCARKISRDFDFCPYCGSDFRPEKRAEKERDFGLLGKDDFVKDFPQFRMPLNFNSLFNSDLFGSLFKQVDKQMRDIDKQIKTEKGSDMSGISISISMDGNEAPKIKVNKFGPEFQNLEVKNIKEKNVPKTKISDEKARKFAKLPKKEAITEVRRLSNKIVYELELPGVANLKDVVINKLENSIEIKAFGKDTVYFKLIPINLPILDYKLKDEKLVLELKPK